MKYWNSLVILGLFGGLQACSPETEVPASQPRGGETSVTESGASGQGGDTPNILYIVADDLGYTDIGPFGSEIPTPHLDETRVCGRTADQLPCRPGLSADTRHAHGQPGHGGGPGVDRQSHVRPARPPIASRLGHPAELLQDAGYTTFMAGKWDLGAGEGYTPATRDSIVPSCWWMPRQAISRNCSGRTRFHTRMTVSRCASISCRRISTRPDITPTGCSTSCSLMTGRHRGLPTCRIRRLTGRCICPRTGWTATPDVTTRATTCFARTLCPCQRTGRHPGGRGYRGV